MSSVLSVSGSAANLRRLAVGLAILSATLVAGCALLPIGGDDSDNTDNGWATVRLVNSNGSTTEWSVSDRADVKKLLVSLTAGRALGLSIAGSMVLSPSVFLPQPEDYQHAATQFLTQTDRSGCRITSSAKTSQFQFEFNYECTNAAASPFEPSAPTH
jgi:hypothetical protein